ncbi:MAG: DEAD/DEAH box helicase [Acinetobacter sp.]|nr:DEAD/DEAH box helicase [Acinetobacter sp.]
MTTQMTKEQEKFFSGQISQLKAHAVEATLSILGVQDKVRKHLEKELNAGIMGSPVFDVLFPWQGQKKKMGEFTDLFHAKTIEKVLEEQIPTPYKHQVEAWQKLKDQSQVNSLVVTSGTGSGKTECFLAPIVDDLVRTLDNPDDNGEGVRALFLYPLNALINSQRERLTEYTNPFQGKIRFCLYNGKTPETMDEKSGQGKAARENNAGEVLDRKNLREKPPQMLITNSTMLEYMLIRPADHPILAKSQGKLKYIVLDEAHSYLGSMAAELALLLKRTFLAFGVEAENIHFIATSATIGDDENAIRELKEFLSSLTGAQKDRIHVITANREIPTLTPHASNGQETLEDLLAIDHGQMVSPKRFERLEQHERARKIREAFIPDGRAKALQLDTLVKTIVTNKAENTKEAEEKDLLAWLDLLAHTKKNDEEPAFLPLRAHVFQRTLAGLYSCVNPTCTKKEKDSDLGNQWPFGYLYAYEPQNSKCECGFPIYGVQMCGDCSTPYLLVRKGNTKSGKEQLKKYYAEQHDEYMLDTDMATDTTTNVVWVLPKSVTGEIENVDSRYLNQNGELYGRLPKEDCIEIDYIKPISKDKRDDDNLDEEISNNKSRCQLPSCAGVVNMQYLGMPFYMSEAVNVLLPYCPPHNSKVSLPFDGRRMITFTDSRQGTSRLTMKLNDDSTRHVTRHVVYHEILDKGEDCENKDVKDKKAALKIKKDEKVEQENQLKQSDPGESTGIEYVIKHLEKGIAKIEDELQELEKDSFATQYHKSSTWSEVVERLTTEVADGGCLSYGKKVLKLLEDKDNKDAARILLLNELAYRPKRANTLETLGLISFYYPALDKVSAPANWVAESKLTEQNWREFLKILLDFYIRDKRCFALSKEDNDALSSRFSSRNVLLEPVKESEQGVSWKKTWLVARENKDGSVSQKNHRIVKLLMLATQIENVDKIQSWLNTAWLHLKEHKLIVPHSDSNSNTEGYKFNFDQVHLAIPKALYICPVTNRFLDTTFAGYTPYAYGKLESMKQQKQEFNCGEKVTMPIPASYNEDALEKSRKLRDWIANNNDIINAFKEKNLWSDISSRVITEYRIICSEEHSAQINGEALQDLEQNFKEGERNILNCSTTMEMGVDIGGLSSVAMSNVPPHPANYLQRAGRAGRRGESTAFAYTICKNNTHDLRVYKHTDWSFTTKIQPPKAILSSKKIVLRHINAYLLGNSLKDLHASSDNTSSTLSMKLAEFLLGWKPDSKKFKMDFIKDKLAAFKKEKEKDKDKPWERVKSSLYEQLIERLESYVRDSELKSLQVAKDIQKICQHSSYEGNEAHTILQESIASFKSLENGIFAKIGRIFDEYADAGGEYKEQYQKKLVKKLESLANEHLLSALVHAGILPALGFPSDIVQLDTMTYAQQKAEDKQKAECEDNLFRFAGEATRELSIALQEYAPGNTVAIHGRVYKSAGIDLEHYFQKEMGGDTTAQDIREVRYCKHCGQSFIDQPVEDCHCCENPSFQAYQYIQPKGFKVDFYSEPTNKYEQREYIATIDPLVQVDEAIQWQHNPLFSYRSDADGKIFYMHKGRKGHGFFVCLACGRAESILYNKEHKLKKEKEHDGKKFDSMYKLQEYKFSKHRPLYPTGQTSGDYCIAYGRSGLIQDVQLGFDAGTSIFEFVPRDPKTGEYYQYMSKNDDRGTDFLRSLAVALRHGLAKCLGIDTKELRFICKSVVIGDDHDQPVGVICLYDQSKGGVGYANLAQQYMYEVLDHASELVNHCSCGSSCHDCLLEFDTKGDAEILDRNMVAEYLKELLDKLGEFKNDLNLTEIDAQPAFGSFNDIITQHFGSYDTISLNLHGNAEHWNSFVTLYDKVNSWLKIGKNVQLFIDDKQLSQLNAVEKDLIFGWLTTSRDKFKVYQKAKNDEMIVQLSNASSQDECMSFFAYDPTENEFQSSAATPQEDMYWNTENAWAVYSRKCEKISGDILEKEKFKVDSTTLSVFSISKDDSEANKAIAKSGYMQFLWQKCLENSVIESKVDKGVKIKKVYYRDPYIRRTLDIYIVVNLFSILKAYYDDASELEVTTKVPDAGNKQNGQNRQDKIQWDDTSIREWSNKIRTLIYQATGVKYNQTAFNFETEVEHDRKLFIYWADGCRTEIMIGHGLCGPVEFIEGKGIRFSEFIKDFNKLDRETELAMDPDDMQRLYEKLKGRGPSILRLKAELNISIDGDIAKNKKV